jgi:hypothetical protein
MLSSCSLDQGGKMAKLEKLSSFLRFISIRKYYFSISYGKRRLPATLLQVA